MQCIADEIRHVQDGMTRDYAANFKFNQTSNSKASANFVKTGKKSRLYFSEGIYLYDSLLFFLVAGGQGLILLLG